MSVGMRLRNIARTVELERQNRALEQENAELKRHLYMRRCIADPRPEVERRTK